MFNHHTSNKTIVFTLLFITLFIGFFFNENSSGGALPDFLMRIEIINSFLPHQIKADELNTIVLESIKELDCSSIKDLGKLISFLKSKYPGQLDMQEVAEKAKKNLQ